MIATARRMRTHKHNVASVVADIGGLTLQWLAQHDIPYDEIFFGKPWCVGIEEAENKPNTLNIFPSTTTTVFISTSHTTNQYSGLLLILCDYFIVTILCVVGLFLLQGSFLH